MKDFSMIDQVYGRKIEKEVGAITGKMEPGLRNGIAVLGQVVANGQPVKITSLPTNSVPVKLIFDPKRRKFPI